MYKKSFFILIICLASLTLFAQNNLIVKGKITNSTSPYIYLANVLTEQTIDSCKLSDKGDFMFQTKIAKTDFFRLSLEGENYLMGIFQPNEIVNIAWDLNDLYKPVITGSPNSELIYSTLKETQALDKKMEEFKTTIENQKKDRIRKMINENPASLACLFFIDNLDITQDGALYKKLSENLNKSFSGNTLVDNLKAKVDKLSNLGVGGEAPEIDLPNPEGKSIKLSSLRGNIVLIDFWASWCKPCRAESPRIVKLYEKYHKKGFEIYSVSLDQTKEDWVKAIEKDNLGKWTHVSDLKYWDSQASQMYGVEAIPYTVLLDKTGKIIAKELRGEDLEKKLEEILK